ncbi:MAG: pseudouridine synthase [Legionellaceae bacterium]|nr:pseudouridine synthase [Legionellaceae bacterium]HAF87194.1 pseudouridine synthase [Legionellales bacterium]HCA89842.1 pseudouridine synthase [Legionellales bacterium]|tara:strand:- start:3708 stop:4250 length:543 start_codon:yes stop_codon:yes gene_type:complete
MTSLLLFNKPFGVLTQFRKNDPNERTLADYIDKPNFYPAGRLDKHSEGLLLLTNNGHLQQQLTHPRQGKYKYYWVQVEGKPSKAMLLPLQRGLITSSNQYLPAKVSIIDEPLIWERFPPIRKRQSIPTSWLEIGLCEGKNHQIRKMTAFIGFPTLRLIRFKIDRYELKNLKPGEYCLISI